MFSREQLLTLIFLCVVYLCHSPLSFGTDSLCVKIRLSGLFYIRFLDHCLSTAFQKKKMTSWLKKVFIAQPPL